MSPATIITLVLWCYGVVRSTVGCPMIICNFVSMWNSAYLKKTTPFWWKGFPANNLAEWLNTGV